MFNPHSEETKKILDEGDLLLDPINNMEHGKTYAVGRYELQRYFSRNYNPEKGETMQSELSRWLDFILKVSNIKHFYDFSTDMYLFTKVIT